MSSKLERDIEEVLAKVEKFPPRRSFWGRVRRRLAGLLAGPAGAVAGIPRPHVNAGHVLLAGITLIVIAWVFGDSLGGDTLVRVLIGLGIALFIGAFIFSLRRQSASRTPEKRWRGQPMDDLGESGSWWQRRRPRR